MPFSRAAQKLHSIAKHMGTTRIIVRERGAGWPALGDASQDTWVVLQRLHESPRAFALRLEERLAALEKSEAVLRQAVLVAGPNGAALRPKLTALLLRALGDRGSLVFTADRGKKRQLEAQLTGLVDELESMKVLPHVGVRFSTLAEPRPLALIRHRGGRRRARPRLTRRAPVGQTRAAH